MELTRQRALEEAKTYPISHVGYWGPYLVVARPRFPPIVLDARLLDTIYDAKLSAKLPAALSAASVGTAGLAIASVIPGGILAAVGLSLLAHERFLETRRRQKTAELVLRIASLEVALTIGDGPEVSEKIANALTPYTRDQPIATLESYHDVKRRLQAAASGAKIQSVAEAVTVGDSIIRVDDGRLRIGKEFFSLKSVEDLAKRGGNLELIDGSRFQAALALLIVAEWRREESGEDVTALREKLDAYEAWSGQGGIR